MSFKNKSLKIVLVVVFLFASIGFFNLNTPTVRAMTAAEIEALIAQLQVQITDLQKQLAEITGEEMVWCHDFTFNLRYGDGYDVAGATGREIQALQTALIKEGFKNLSSEKANGYFGDYTASAIVGFQEKYKEDVLAPWGLAHGTGFVGSTTKQKLNELYGYRVVKPYIRVLLPNGGEEWVKGNTYQISWDAKGLDKVVIELGGYDENGNPIRQWYTINEEIAAYFASLKLGFYEWSIPYDIEEKFQTPPTKYKIRVRNFGLPISTSDESDNYFSIVEKLCGDVNCDGKVNMGDVGVLRNYVAHPGQSTICSEWAADVTCDGNIDMGDVVLLRNHITYPENDKCVLKCCEDIDGLVGYWKFDEGSGITAKDSSGSGNDGILVNNPTWVDGQVGKALNFDGVDNYIDCENDSSLDITDAITIEAWVKLNALGAWQHIIGKQGMWRISGYDFRVTINNKLQFATLSSFYDVNSATAFTTGVWYHVVAVQSGTSYKKIYLNGVEDGIKTNPGAIVSTLSSHLQIGRAPLWDAEYFNGTIDEVRIYNRALSSEEILAHYQSGISN
ncbi:hypothetical protein KAU51_00745 [Candidatus Parcubacteria bacterium]|nr:hypothetical protein [Candidatus Parcubacteria bacterium]